MSPKHKYADLFTKKFSETVEFKNFPSNLDGVFVMNEEIFYVKNSTFGSWNFNYCRAAGRAVQGALFKCRG